jgi:hypothetical protein
MCIYYTLTQFCVLIIHSAIAIEPCVDTIYGYIPAKDVDNHLLLDGDQASLIVAAKASNPSLAYEYYSQGK